LLKVIAETEEKIATIKKTKPECLNINIKDSVFEVSERTQSSLEILEECPFELDEWYKENKENSWAIRAIKIWYLFHK